MSVFLIGLMIGMRVDAEVKYQLGNMFPVKPIKTVTMLKYLSTTD